MSNVFVRLFLVVMFFFLQMTSGFADEVNIALNKRVFAEHEQPGYEAANAVDGVISDASRWAPGRVNDDRYVEVDLEDTYDLVRAHIVTGYRDKKAIKNYQLKYSSDGANWSNIPEGEVQDLSDTQTEMNLVFSQSVNASYVRFYCLDDYKENCRLKELEIYADTGGGGDPDPLNNAPVINDVVNQTMDAGSSLTITCLASDPDGDPLTLSFIGTLPLFAVFEDYGDGTGSLTLNPTETDEGNYDFHVQVSDGELTDSDVFSVVVNGTSPPVGEGIHRKVFRSDIPREDRGEVRWPFWEYLPPGYEPDRVQGYPMLVFLHGYGERGEDLEAVLKHGPPMLIDKGRWPSSRPFVVISPQSSGGAFNWDRLYIQIEYLKTRNNIDPESVYLTGLSYGAMSTFSYLKENGAAGRRNIAAAIPISGSTSHSTDPNMMCPAAPVPVWAFHGSADGTRDPNGSILPVETVNNYCSPLVPWKVTIYEGVNHNAWSRTYDLSGMDASNVSPDYDPFDQDIYEWLLQYRLDF